MGKGKTTSTSTSQPWAPMQGYLKDGASDLTDLYNSGGLKTDYSGDWVADMTNGQGNALQSIIGQAGANSGVLNGLVGNLSGLASGDTTGQWDTISQNVIDTLTPQINSSFAGSGMTGSTLHQQNLSKGLSQGLGTAYNDFAQQQVGNQLNATSSIAGLLGQMTGNAQSAYDAESAYQTQAQNELDSQYQNSLLGQNADYEAITNYLNVISGMAGLGGQSSTTQKQSGGLLGNLLGAIGTVGKMSDRRLKENIRRVGRLDNGLSVYLYNYKGFSEPQIGVMADEVEAVLPEAVMEVHGFKAVNYGAL